MKCSKCSFYHSSACWNRCDLIESECFRPCIEKDCSLIDDNYKVKETIEPLGLVKGEIVYQKGEDKNAETR